MLRGPQAFVAHMLAKERVLFTIAYTSSAVATLYCSMHLKSFFLTALFSSIEVCEALSSLFSRYRSVH
jgi:hypothetical protein